MSFNLIASTAITASGESISSLLPKIEELLVGIVGFAVLLFILKKFAYPQFEATFQERTAAIEGGIEKAEKAQEQASAALAQYQAQLADARGEASTIRSEAQADRARIVEEARSEATAAAEQVTARASAQMEADRLAAKAELSAEVGRIALDLASRVVGEALTDDARARATVDRFIADLESSTQEGTR
jgi:F-type H+-transporting ATPase subunit b